MLIDLSGKVVVVTGGGQGIGRVIAFTFALEGAKVIVCDLEETRSLWKEAPGSEHTVWMSCDVRENAQVTKTVSDIYERFGRIDILVNNAGINAEGLVEDLDDNALMRCLDVNVAGVFRMCKAVAPIMKLQRSGRIINAASFAAIIPSIGSAAYAASKAAVVQFTRVLAGELGPWNVTVNAYAPGMVPTQLNGFAEMGAVAQDRLLDTLTLRRWETPEDVANTVCFLASEAAGYITGTLVDVSGGKLATQIPSRSYETAAAAGTNP